MTNHTTARRILLRSALFGALALCFVAPVPAGPAMPGTPPETAQSAELRWKFTAGTELVYRQVMHNEMEMPQGLGTSVTDMESTQRWEILEVASNGNATIRVTTDRVRMSMQSPMGNMTVDSAEETPPKGTPLDAITAMAGTSYTIVVDVTGTLTSIEGLEEMRTKLLEALPDASMAQILEPLLTEDTLQGQWQQGMYAMPEESVSVGTTWSRSFSVPVPMFGNMTTDSRYEVEAIDGDIVVIASTATMAIEESSDSQSPVSMQFNNADLRGTGRFDVGRGLLLLSESTMAMEMSMAMGGEKMVMESIATMTLELVEGGG